MELKKFAGIVAEGVQEKMGDDYEISIVTSQKNNSILLTGIVLNQKEDSVSPTIYINDLLAEYNQKKRELADIVEEVIQRYEKSLEKIGEMHEFSAELVHCAEKVIFRLVSRDLNQHLLTDVPYIPFMDLAITFHIAVSITEKYMQTIRVTKELQRRWNISVEMLFKLAKENTEKLLPLWMDGLAEIIGRYIELDKNNLTNMEETDMIVITNYLAVNGAAAILYDGVLDHLAEQYDSDLYVIPSSVHEMIVMPVNGGEPIELLTGIVKEINLRFVNVDEILSNRVYTYRKDEKKFV